MRGDMCLTYGETDNQIEITKMEANVLVYLNVRDFDLAVTDYDSFGDLLEERALDVVRAWSSPMDRIPDDVKLREYEPLRVDKLTNVTVFRVLVEVTY